MKIIKDGNGKVVAWRHWFKWYIQVKYLHEYYPLSRHKKENK